MSRAPFSKIYIVAGNDGELCNFADSKEVAEEMCCECLHGHDEPHRAYVYRRGRIVPIEHPGGEP